MDQYPVSNHGKIIKGQDEIKGLEQKAKKGVNFKGWKLDYPVISKKIKNY